MQFTEIYVRGAPQVVPCLAIDDRVVIVTGRRPRIAEIQDEEWLDGGSNSSAMEFVEQLKQSKLLKADLFTFCEKVNDPLPRYPLPYRWDSVAVIPITSYECWWSKRISNHVRQDVNRSVKRGISVRSVEFTGELVEGIAAIYNETPVRQGRPFWHYGKSVDEARRMNATYLERSEFLGAYLNEELIGFLKVVYVDGIARLMQIIAKEAHWDKRPMNALIAKAVQLCELRKCSHLVYGNYQYMQGPDSLTDFKRRNGFVELLVPRYYVGLSSLGRLVLLLQLERGLRAWVPESVQAFARRVRASIYRYRHGAQTSLKPISSTGVLQK
jgi:hypothetical protein